MKKIILILFLSFSCNEKIINCNELIEEDRLVYLDGKLYTGKCTTNNENNQVLEQKSYKDGERSGKFMKYYPNGKMEYLGYCKNNELHGSYTSFFENGDLNVEGSFDLGYKIGVWKTYNPEGDLIKVETFTKNE